MRARRSSSPVLPAAWAALAREYAARGAILRLVGRREAALRKLAASLPNPNAARVYAADVRDADAMAAAAQDFLDHFGCPDIVVANAGVSVGTVAGEREDRLPSAR